MNVLGRLDENDIVEAEYASARALIAARGAHASRPDVGVVRAALKITEAFRALVRGYRAGLNQQYDEVIALSKDAWGKGEEAKSIAPEIATIADQVQSSASSMANSARGLQAQ